MVTSNQEEELEAVKQDLEDLVDLYQRQRGTTAAIIACRVFVKELKWCHDKGHGGVTANAKDHVFSERVTTKTHE